MVDHHLLLACDADPVEGRKGEQADPTGNPVGKEENLGDAPDPLRGIHRMADPVVDAVGDQRLFDIDFERRGPVAAQIVMRTPKDPERKDKEESTNDAQVDFRAG